MDDILKKTMFQEISSVMEQIEGITEKYGHSVDLVYTLAFGLLEDEGEDVNKWSLAYSYNCRDDEEFTEFMSLQVKAYTETTEEEPPSFTTGFSLN
jgi:hypothetical protein